MMYGINAIKLKSLITNSESLTDNNNPVFVFENELYCKTLDGAKAICCLLKSITGAAYVIESTGSHFFSTTQNVYRIRLRNA